MRDGRVIAAWIFDGVTGINGRNYLPGVTDAAWLVERAGEHLQSVAAQDIALPDLLAQLVDRLQDDWRTISHGLALPKGYDIPAACLVLVKEYADGWQALRLGTPCYWSRTRPCDWCRRPTAISIPSRCTFAKRRAAAGRMAFPTSRLS